jgi:DNA-binding transcriptional MerR regulator
MTTKNARNARKTALKKPPTTAELAAALEVSGRRISQLKAIGLPVHSLEAALEWRKAQHGADDSAAELRRRRIALLKQQERRARIEADAAEGKLMSRAVVKAEAEGIAAAVSAFARKIERELPQLLLGLPLERSRLICKNAVREMVLMLKDKQSEFWAAHPEVSDK